MPRPKMKKPKDALDALNLLTKGTQMTKNIKITESVYNKLIEYKKNDKKIKSLSEVIASLIALHELRG